MSSNRVDKSDILVRLEPLLLFLVFYLPGYLSQSRPLSGRVFNDLAFNLTYLLQALPRIALLLYLILLRSRMSHSGEQFASPLARYGLRRLRPVDFGWAAAIIAVIELILVPLTLLGGLLSRSGGGLSVETVHWQLTNPAMLPVVFVTSMAAGYSEELFFRSYLLTTLPMLGVGTGVAIATSTILFGLGHLYEGIVGFVGAVAIGIVMSLVFVRKRNLHAIAIAHGVYNFITLLATLPHSGVHL